MADSKKGKSKKAGRNKGRWLMWAAKGGLRRKLAQVLKSNGYKFALAWATARNMQGDLARAKAKRQVQLDRRHKVLA